jgi:hypothetical protein
MKTGAFTTTLTIRIAFAASMQLWSCHVMVADNGPTATPAKIDKPFIVNFEFGRKASPFVDPDHPPVLELTGVTWNLRTLKGFAEYHNCDSSEPKKVEGRQIVEWQGYLPFFWPYVRLEVSNQWEGEWTVIGSSPSGTDGTEAVVLMYPDRAAHVDRSAPSNSSCELDLTPFREFIGKFKYGRVVLRSGGASQTIVLTDLLPPEPSPTPAPTSGDSSTASAENLRGDTK